MHLQVIKVQPFTKEYWMFVYIAAKTFPLHLPVIVYAPIRKNANLIVCKLDDKVIGGFVLSDLPLNIFRFKNLCDRQKRMYLWKFIEMGYKYLTYVVIDKKYRGRGFGKNLFNYAKKRYNIKSYLTPLNPDLQEFYEKLGAKVYRTDDNRLIEGIKSPSMVFDDN